MEPRLSAVERANRTGRWEQALRLVRAVDPPVALSRQWGRWQVLLGAGLAAARNGGDQAAEAWSLHQLGTRALALGDEREARVLLRQALSIRRALGDPAGAAVTKYHLDLLDRPPPPHPRGPGGARHSDRRCSGVSPSCSPSS